MFAQVNADFTASSTSGCGSLQVTFNDQSTSSNGSIVTWSWDLGGVNSILENPGRIFGTPGLYTICLTVTDSQGDSDTECKNDFIQVFNLPQPNFTADPTEGCGPLEVTFEDLSTSADGNIVEWIWGVGGSNGVIIDDGSLPSITNTYYLPDTFSINLTVFDDNGCTNTITQDDFITVFPQPEISISYSDSFNCDPPLVVSFFNDNPEPNVNYTWDFGNGNPVYEGTTPSPVIFNQVGQYSITVVAENQNTLCQDTFILEEIISVGTPVDFSFSQEEGCVISEITFYDESLLPADSVVWNFGDGTFSTESNPTHTYSTPDCYTVTLTRYVDGCATTISSDNCVEIYSYPSVSFSYQNTIGCSLPQTIDFFQSTPNVVNSWYWEFGDGTTSTIEDTSHTFNDYGIYPVSLTVTDIFGCSNTFVDTIEIIELEASIEFDEIFGCVPLTFDLSENSTTVSPIVDWSWWVDTSFSDPNTPLFVSGLENPTFTISDTGVYDVRLIVTNDLGCMDTIYSFGGISVGMPPVVNFEANPLHACAGEPIQFLDLSSSYVNEWFWDFGDSTFSIDQNPVHEYNAADTFDVSLTAFHNGCFSTIEFEDYIITILPVAAFSAIYDCDNPFYVEFIDESSGADSIIWDLGLPGDMDTSTMLNPNIVYPDTGCYEVVQTAFNFTTGCIDETSMTICVTIPYASFELDTLIGCAPLSIDLIDNSIFAMQWDWVAPGADITTTDNINYTLTYNSPGVYNYVQLIITDMNGCQDTTDFSGDIFVNGVTADFTSAPSGGCAPLNVQFFDNSSSLYGGGIVDWQWEFGGIAYPNSIPNPTYLFPTTGIYDVILTATDDWGCSGSFSYSEAIHVTQPIPYFSGDSLGCTTAFASFYNGSLGESLTFYWDFGDTGISTDENPTHQYLNEGIYEVCLTITDLYGCSKTYCRDIEIANPIANFDLDETYSNCPPLLVNFNNLSLYASQYEWDFGDGSGVSNLENPPHVYTIPGIYDVSLIANSTENCADTLLIEDLIVLEGPSGSFYFDIDSACVPATITFYGESDDYYDYIWDFGNGELDTVLNVIADTTVHVFNDPGVFFPNLILVNSENCQRALESPIPIVLQTLDVDFVATDTLLCGITDIKIMNLTNSTEPISFIEWTFEGGNPSMSNDFEPIVSYSSIGAYDVTLVVDNGFCIDTLVKENYINNALAPQALFNQSADTGCTPLGIQYTDQSTIAIGSIALWDWDLGDGDSSDIADPFHVYEQSGDLPVQLIVTSDMGCQDTASANISIYPSPVVTLWAAEPEICIGDYVELGAAIVDTTGVTYAWSPDNTLSCLDCLFPTANPISTTTYSFISTNPNGCSDTSEITVNVLPYEIPTITITEDTTICQGGSIQLLVSGGGNMGTYDWDDSTSGLSCYINCQNPMASPLDTSTYVVTVTNIYGCDAQDSVQIATIDQSQPFAGEDEIICVGDSVQLSLTMPGTPTWLTINDLSCVDCSDPIAFPGFTTNYIVSLITDDYGCEIFDSVLVTVLTADDIDAGDDVEICDGETITLSGTGEGAATWTPSNSLNNPNLLSPEATPSVSTFYVLSLENGNCILWDSVYISVINQTEVSANDYVICEGDTVELETWGLADTYLWSPPATLSDPTAQNPLAFPSETTTYLLEASQTTCEPDTATSTVFVDPYPDVTLPSVIQFFSGTPIDIEVTSIDDRHYFYEWSPADSLSCNNCPDPIFTSSVPMILTVTVTDSETGCEIVLSTYMERLDYCTGDLISVPNTFSPNGDGINDELELFSNTITEITTFKVFNRWGGLVYETDDFYAKWDGTHRGNHLPVGVYVYFIESTCKINGTKFLKKGDITILR